MSRRSGNAAAVADNMDDPQKRQEKFRQNLLKRDNNCCVVTDDMDYAQFEKLGSPDNIECGSTQGVHIIPFSFATWGVGREVI